MSNVVLQELHERRLQICEAISNITSMRRGILNEMYYNETRKDGTVARRGPYYNITFKGEKNKTITSSVPKKDLQYFKGETSKYKNFRALCDEYIDVCEKISLLSREDSEERN